MGVRLWLIAVGLSTIGFAGSVFACDGVIQDPPDTTHTNSGSIAVGKDGCLHSRPAYSVDPETPEQHAKGRAAADAYYVQYNQQMHERMAALDGGVGMSVIQQLSGKRWLPYPPETMLRVYEDTLLACERAGAEYRNDSVTKGCLENASAAIKVWGSDYSDERISDERWATCAAMTQFRQSEDFAAWANCLN